MLGDDIGAVIINVGRFETRVGEAGEESPKYVIPSYLGVTTESQTQANFGEMEVETKPKTILSTGGALSHYKETMRISSPFQNDGDAVDWDLYFGLVSDSLKAIHIDPAQHPLLFTEPSDSTTQFRSQLIQRAFETYSPPGFFLAKEATLSCYASGRATSLVVDSGSRATTVCAVHDGYVLKKSLLSSIVAGDFISQSILYSLSTKNKIITPSYAFKKRKLQNGKWQVTPNNLPFNESFHNYHVMKIINDLKLHCKLPERTAEYTNKSDFELPDGSIIQLDSDILFSPDYMFKPTGDSLPVQQLVMNCIASCDTDIKKDLYNGIIVTGGNTLFPGFVDKLQRNINVPSMYKFKIIAASDSAERKFSSWIGGSILGSLGSMHSMWVSKAEYEEIGPSIVEKKCP